MNSTGIINFLLESNKILKPHGVCQNKVQMENLFEKSENV
jgi:hypothetical protein